jgi:membrane protein DedA with SNARE-associated domain
MLAMSEYLLTHGSYLLIMLVLVLAGGGLPLPEEVPVVAAGVLSSTGQMHPGLAFAACLAGALLGDCVMYAIGRHFGRRVVREHRLWARFVHPEREAQIEHMLQVHGLKVFFLARFLVGLRSPVYLAAGVLRVPFRRFLFFDLLCATAVIGTFFGLSYCFGHAIARWVRGAELLLTLAVVAAILGMGLYFWRKRQPTIHAGMDDLSCADGDEQAPPGAFEKGPDAEEAPRELAEQV